MLNQTQITANSNINELILVTKAIGGSSLGAIVSIILSYVLKWCKSKVKIFV
jgi:hypothetical protein